MRRPSSERNVEKHMPNSDGRPKEQSPTRSTTEYVRICGFNGLSALGALCSEGESIHSTSTSCADRSTEAPGHAQMGTSGSWSGRRSPPGQMDVGQAVRGQEGRPANATDG
jgi:hypothetical protein